MSKRSANSPEGRPTRNDVARLANLSGTTVSRVLSGNPDESVSPQVRERVLKAARELGYTPNSAAQALRSGRTGLIGFWMCLEYSRYRSMVLDEMRRHLAPTDFALAVTDVDEDYQGHHSLARALRVPTDGIIAFDPSVSAEAFADSTDQLAANRPFVSMGAFWSEKRSYVGVDLKAGAEEAMHHLFGTGRHRIAYLAPAGTYFVDGGARYEGYREKMAEAGLPGQTLEVVDRPLERIPSLVQNLRACMANDSLPEALLCFYDDIAVDSVVALMEIGLVPGRDVAVVGFNGNEGLDRAPCPITTVRQPVEKMCALAFEFLKAQMDDPTAPLQKEILKPTLIVRESTAR